MVRERELCICNQIVIVMKLFILLILGLMQPLAGSDDTFSRGKSVYVESPDKELSAEIGDALQKWGYWKVADNAAGADIVMRVDVQVSGGVTWNSWGGKSIALSAELKSDGDSWKSPYFKASPNGGNGFNSQRAAVRKLVGGLKKQFG